MDQARTLASNVVDQASHIIGGSQGAAQDAAKTAENKAGERE